MVLAECFVGGVRAGCGVLVLAGCEVSGEVADESVGYVLFERWWNRACGTHGVGEEGGEGLDH